MNKRKKMWGLKEIYTSMFITAFFTIAKEATCVH
jgi:hypothetical protein